MDKPLWQRTGEEFRFLSKSATSDSAPRQPKVTSDASSPKYVYGLSGIAQAFGCSIPTANRIKRNGKIDKDNEDLDRLTSTLHYILEEVNRTQSRGFRR